MTSKRILIVVSSLAAVSFPLGGVAGEESHLPSIAFKLVPLSEGITVIEEEEVTVWQFAAPSGERSRFRVKMAVVLSVHFELCETDPGACGGGEGPIHCVGGGFEPLPVTAPACGCR